MPKAKAKPKAKPVVAKKKKKVIAAKPRKKALRQPRKLVQLKKAKAEQATQKNIQRKQAEEAAWLQAQAAAAAVKPLPRYYAPPPPQPPAPLYYYPPPPAPAPAPPIPFITSADIQRAFPKRRTPPAPRSVPPSAVVFPSVPTHVPNLQRTRVSEKRTVRSPIRFPPGEPFKFVSPLGESEQKRARTVPKKKVDWEKVPAQWNFTETHYPRPKTQSPPRKNYTKTSHFPARIPRPGMTGKPMPVKAETPEEIVAQTYIAPMHQVPAVGAADVQPRRVQTLPRIAGPGNITASKRALAASKSSSVPLTIVKKTYMAPMQQLPARTVVAKTYTAPYVPIVVRKTYDAPLVRTTYTAPMRYLPVPVFGALHRANLTKKLSD